MKNKTTLMLVALIALIAFFAANVSVSYAGSGGVYELSWDTIDGGGGTSSGGIYSLSGTIGQPDAGSHSGGSYSLGGGFWVSAFGNNINIYLPFIKR